MKKFLLLFIVAWGVCSTPAFGWGRAGHDAITYIAECNLTPKAKKNIEKYLGHSIVHDASWMDVIRHTPPYKHTSNWHTDELSEENIYEPRKNGDALFGIEQAVEKLRNYRSLDDSTVVMSIRCLLHLVGDMHCPSHVKVPQYSAFSFMVGDKKIGFHGFWDTTIIEANNRWGYLEWQHQLDRCTKQQKHAIMAGTPREWLTESGRDCRIIYEWIKPDQVFDNNGYRDMLNAMRPLSESQILKAGYRLAGLLNELFG